MIKKYEMEMLTHTRLSLRHLCGLAFPAWTYRLQFRLEYSTRCNTFVFTGVRSAIAV